MVYQFDIDTDVKNPSNFDTCSVVESTYCQECDKNFDADCMYCPDCGERLEDI